MRDKVLVIARGHLAMEGQHDMRVESDRLSEALAWARKEVARAGGVIGDGEVPYWTNGRAKGRAALAMRIIVAARGVDRLIATNGDSGRAVDAQRQLGQLLARWYRTVSRLEADGVIDDDLADDIQRLWRQAIRDGIPDRRRVTHIAKILKARRGEDAPSRSTLANHLDDVGLKPKKKRK